MIRPVVPVLVRASCLTVCALFLAGAPCFAEISTKADAAGVIHYPEINSNGGIGNQAGITFEDHSGTVFGGASAMAHTSGQKGGIDGNGTSGEGSVAGTMIAEIGILHGRVGASSTSTTHPGPGFVNGDASMFDGSNEASFRDEAIAYNPDFALNVPISVIVRTSLDWNGGLTDGPNAVSTVGATSYINVAGYGSDTVSFLHDSSGFTRNVQSVPLTITVLNGTTLDVLGRLNVLAEERLVGIADTAYASVTSDALNTAHFYIDGALPGTTVMSVTGHAYGSPVPEPTGSLAGILGLGCLVTGRRRR
jgi:hypothetical protein